MTKCIGLAFIARSGSRFVSHIPHCWVNFLSRFSVRKFIMFDSGSSTSSSDHSPSTNLSKRSGHNIFGIGRQDVLGPCV